MQLISIKNTLWYIFKKLSNLGLSISLLLLIASISIIGTIIEQNQSILYYQKNYPINNQLFNQIVNWKIIINLGLDHIYLNPCFMLLLTLFFCSLLTCSFSNQLPKLKNARKWKFFQQDKKTRNKSHITNLETISFPNIIYSLHSSKYYVFHKEKQIYAYKGLSGRIAPIFVHFSMILTLIGCLISLLGGFTAQEIVPKGEIFHIKNIIQSGFNSKLPDNLTGRIKDFDIKYNPDKSIQQFVSNLELYNNESRNIKQKYIFVNSPLIFNGTTFYQTDWRIDSIRLKIGNGNIIQQKAIKRTINKQVFWSCQLPINEKDYIIMIINKLNDNISIYDISNHLLTSVRLNEKIVINSTIFQILEVMTKTGLQIKTDPGIRITYTGFLVLMISIVISYISYSQIWVTSILEHIEIVGSTNRAKLTFEEELINIQEIYTQYTWQ
uniref:Cytochrome c biogenesis protein Ccs1 n=1 Tax=Gracilaria vermiculophylla TaxID=2608709 RepID=A0A345U8P8_9FLOR|nr:Cytochrome c biogenesis protein [Gracilaria vermiculophylla]AXI96834.1 Cytochrome c biogenesis protein [Gracilaria vermiculophylla]QXU75048.1 Cytochrome c biogenesis protein [Gracilaria vermiculophylla]